MSIVATGALARAYIEIADREADSNRIARVVLYLIGVGWFDLTDVFPSGQDGFCLPEPIGCNCTITDVSDRGWSNVKYEIEWLCSRKLWLRLGSHGQSEPLRWFQAVE